MSEDFMSMLGFWILLYLAMFLNGYQLATKFTKFLSTAIVVFLILAGFCLIYLLVILDWMIILPTTSWEIINYIVFLYLFFSSSLGMGYILGKVSKV